MHPVVAKYRSLPNDTDHLGDSLENDNKCKLLEELDDFANDPDVSELLLAIMRNSREYDLARVEAIKVAGIYVEQTCVHHYAIFSELHRIAADESEDEMIRGWAERYIE